MNFIKINKLIFMLLLSYFPQDYSRLSSIYITCSYGLGRKPISTLCKAATACLPAHSTHCLCCCKQLSSVSLFLPPCFVTIQAGRFGHSWTPPGAAAFMLSAAEASATTHFHALKQSLLCRLSF